VVPTTVVIAPPLKVPSLNVPIPSVDRIRYVVGFVYPEMEPVPEKVPEIVICMPTDKLVVAEVKVKVPAVSVITAPEIVLTDVGALGQ
jgi:hypothetical protein